MKNNQVLLSINCNLIYTNIIVALLYTSCNSNEQKASISKVNLSETNNNYKLPPNKICDFDSITVEEGIANGKKLLKIEKTRILSAEAKEIIKPYLLDSVSKGYCCCIDTIIGELKTFSKGKLCNELRIIPVGATVELERNVKNVTLVPYGYAFRISIPPKIWRKIMNKAELIRIE